MAAQDEDGAGENEDDLTHVGPDNVVANTNNFVSAAHKACWINMGI